MSTITINNRTIPLREQSTVLQACTSAGYVVPHFCYYEDLSVAGSCRMCLVEIQKSPKPVVSCAMPATKGMVIFTNTPLVKKAREAILESLLLNHPLDCPICDQGGECDLQDETLQFGSDRGRYYQFKRPVEDKECGPIIKTIMTRCIHCTRCIRFASEIAGFESLGAFGRGKHMEIGTYIQAFITTELSGNLVDLCPVGALTSKPYAYKARNWELQNQTTVDFFDTLCSDIIVSTRKETNVKTLNTTSSLIQTEDTILRILPKLDGIYKGNWISDKSRFAFDGFKHSRASSSNLKNLFAQVTSYVIHAQKESRRSGAFFGALCDVEGIYFTSSFLKSQGHGDLQVGNVLAKTNLDIPFFYSLNYEIESLDKLTMLILIGLNTRYEASLLNTNLRKQQKERKLTYYTIGAYTQLNLNQNHLGNSIRSVISLAENKIKNNIQCYAHTNPSILYSFESLRNKYGFFMQNIIRFVGKKLFTKTQKGERLGLVHAQISSLNFAHLGITSNVRSPIYVNEMKEKGFATLFAIQPDTFMNKKWLSQQQKTTLISWSTHKPTDFMPKCLVPIQNLYEKNGLLFNLEGRLRKLNKVVSHPKNTYSLEIFLFALLLKLVRQKEKISSKDILHLCEQVWGFKEDVLVKAQLENRASPFFFNLVSYTEAENKSQIFPFSPNIYTFYISDSVSANSNTMAECTLFLKNSSNITFNRD